MEQEEIQRAVQEILTQYLEQQQMRKTPERYAVLEEIYHQEGYFTADELFARMDKRFHVSRATIYNALDMFVMLGLVVRFPFGHAACYGKCYRQRDYFHQFCTQCGKVTELHSATVSEALTNIKLKRFRAEHITVCISGLCSKCQAQNTRRRNQLERKLAKAKNAKKSKSSNQTRK